MRTEQPRRATLPDQELIGQVLAAAFAADPVFGWLVPPELADRERRLVRFFTMMARSYLRRNKHVYAGPDGAGSALWSAPGAWKLPLSEIVRESRSAFAAFGATGVSRALRLQLKVEAAHPQTPPHWYLGYLGTRPSHQGRGLGSAMLRTVLTTADSAGTPAYLESSNERNLPFYQRHGFQVVEQVSFAGSPPIWRMWRDPA